MYVINFFGRLPKLKILWHLKYLPWWNTGIVVLGNRPNLKKKLWHFEILTGSQWENLKCRISRKQLILEQSTRGQKWDLNSYSAHMEGTFDA